MITIPVRVAARNIAIPINVSVEYHSGGGGGGGNETAQASDVLTGKTFTARNVLRTGSMPNNGAVSAVINSTASPSYAIPRGFHDGNGSVSVDTTNILAGNIKQGITILSVTGTYSGGTATYQSKNVTPSTVQQTVAADSGYDALSQVVVAAIPYSEELNSAGGYTATIGVI